TTKDEIIVAAWLHNIIFFTKDNSILDLISSILPNNINATSVLRLIENWQTPNSYDEHLIAESDRLARGEPSIWKPGTRTSFYENPVLLRHLVSTLQIPERNAPLPAYCRFKPLEADGIMPITAEEYTSAKTEYKSLWKEFESNLLKLKNLEIDDFIKSLNSLLEHYWWCIPASFENGAESLYQQAKFSAAIAAVLFEYHKQYSSETLESLTDERLMKFRFLKGDISGIQKYIFDLKTTKHNAKLLRAKSFQIFALGEVLSQYLVKQFNVSYANVIMSAGGNLMILVPNTESTRLLMPQIQLEIESYFLREFAGKLAVIVSDGVEASACDLLKENIHDLMSRIGENADLCKQKKMQKALQKNGAILEEFYSLLQKYGECPKCGVFPSRDIDESGNPCECSDCKNLTEIGGNLVRAGTVLLDASKLQSFANMVKVSSKNNLKNAYTVNIFEPGKPVMYIPYTAPSKNGEILTFENIADKSSGNKKLAMFKSDIDNLGLVFSSSLGDRMSFARYADLSHLLHYFFSAYYAWFVHNHFYTKGDVKEKYENAIYTVFSGGDDLCILGAWDAVVQFASDFEKELQKFCNKNPSVSLSGGVALTSSAVPVRNIAAETEENLETSKGRKENGVTVKNSMTVFGVTVSWTEYRNSLEDGKLLEKYLNDKSLSTGVVYKLIDFSRRAERVKNGDCSELINSQAPNLHDRVWKSNFKYIAVRNIDAKNHKDIIDWFLHFVSSQDEIIKSRIAASYALYTQRKS
ncbi:MAG: type III-A CRISPR-associated protein Cas10/Csm1, partial [Treponema sp.]|nr:type III-A CRISPR-associated protein Cas10/Csm1 [Treponema sp.]